MSYISKQKVGNILAHSTQQAKTIKTLLEHGFEHDPNQFTSDHCAIVMVNAQSWPAVIDCDGKIDGKSYLAWSQDYTYRLNKVYEEQGEDNHGQNPI